MGTWDDLFKVENFGHFHHGAQIVSQDRINVASLVFMLQIRLDTWHKCKQRSGKPTSSNLFSFGEVDPELPPGGEFLPVTEIISHFLAGISWYQGRPVFHKLVCRCIHDCEVKKLMYNDNGPKQHAPARACCSLRFSYTVLEGTSSHGKCDYDSSFYNSTAWGRFETITPLLGRRSNSLPKFYADKMLSAPTCRNTISVR